MFNFYNSSLKVLNFTHVDFDGASSNIVIRNYYKDVITKLINYGKEWTILKEIEKEKTKIDAIIFTDFCPCNLTEIQKYNIPVLVLDHHETALKYNSPENNIYIYTKYCGAKLTFKYFNIDNKLDFLTDLIEITNDFDLYILNDKRSKVFNSLYWYMGFNWFVERFFEGDIILTKPEMRFLLRNNQKFKEYYDKLEILELRNKGVACECSIFLTEVSDELQKDGYDWVILYRNDSISLRSKDHINLIEVCKIVGKGGGHKNAAGIPLENDNIIELIKKIDNAVDEVIRTSNYLNNIKS